MRSRFRLTVVGTAALTIALAGGCASATRNTAQTVKVAEPAEPTGPLQLVALADGIGAFPPGSSTPVWRETGAVAALDGSAVFAIHPETTTNAPDALVRLDRRAGAVTATWPLPRADLSISAVSPDGRWVALTNRARGYGSQGRAATAVEVVDTRTGASTYRTTLTGDVQPEAFSVDGTFMFALDYRTGYYRVQTLELATGMRFDTTDRDKTLPPEDMHGHSVHGVMSRDRTLLATLYRNPGDDDEPAFVHVLDLRHGWSYCADLPAPFGTGALGSDAIELTAAGTVVVAANATGRLAEIHVTDVHTPGTSPVRVSYRAGTIAPAGPALLAVPGFEYVLGTLPA